MGAGSNSGAHGGVDHERGAGELLEGVRAASGAAEMGPNTEPATEAPHRVQLSRKAGWRKPANTVVVARPSKLGNPFAVGGQYVVRINDRFGGYAEITIADRADAVRVHRDWINSFIDLEGARRPSEDEIRATLRGKSPACWCGLDQPCHGDTLSKIANS